MSSGRYICTVGVAYPFPLNDQVPLTCTVGVPYPFPKNDQVPLPCMAEVIFSFLLNDQIHLVHRARMHAVPFQHFPIVAVRVPPMDVIQGTL